MNQQERNMNEKLEKILAVVVAAGTIAATILESTKH